jgi:hypothetical protein
MLTNQISYAQLFVWNPRTVTRKYNNSTGAAVTLNIGTVLGRIDNTLYMVPQVSSASDGSQMPRGVLTATITIPANTIQDISVVVSGDVVKTGLILGGSDTLDTLITVGGVVFGTIEDCLIGKGILPIPSAEGTYADN